MSLSSNLDHPALPAGQVLYAVGDIHGRLDLLRRLLEQIEADAYARAEGRVCSLVFLGDYVDRGPDSRGVIAELLARQPQTFDTHFLKGNHEALLLDFLEDARHLDQWLVNGGEATMLSYGVDTEGLERARARPETWRRAFAGMLPPPPRRWPTVMSLIMSWMM